MWLDASYVVMVPGLRINQIKYEGVHLLLPSDLAEAF